jgi:hypothetical protein
LALVLKKELTADQEKALVEDLQKSPTLQFYVKVKTEEATVRML